MIICFQLHKLTWWTRHHKQDPEVDDDGEQQPEEGKQGTGDEITNDNKDKEIAISVVEEDAETTSRQGKTMVGLICALLGVTSDSDCIGVAEGGSGGSEEPPLGGSNRA